MVLLQVIKVHGDSYFEQIHVGMAQLEFCVYENAFGIPIPLSINLTDALHKSIAGDFTTIVNLVSRTR